KKSSLECWFTRQTYSPPADCQPVARSRSILILILILIIIFIPFRGEGDCDYCQDRGIDDSGVRPSSGAASSESPDATKFSGAYLLLHVAAPGDGRTPPL